EDEAALAQLVERTAAEGRRRCVARVDVGDPGRHEHAPGGHEEDGALDERLPGERLAVPDGSVAEVLQLRDHAPLHAGRERGQLAGEDSQGTDCLALHACTCFAVPRTGSRPSGNEVVKSRRWALVRSVRTPRSRPAGSATAARWG